MFARVAAFEFRYQLRQPLFWIVCLFFALMTFGAVTVEQISIGSGGNVNENSPYAVAQIHLVWSVFYMFVTAAFVANVIVRDDETGFGPIVRTTRLRKADYLYGRFAGAFAAAALSFLSIPLAIALGSVMPWLDPDKVGPLLPGSYLFAYFALALPSLLFTGALFFALASVTRSTMWTFFGAVVLFVLWFVANAWAQGRTELEQIAALLDPFGMTAYDLATRYWTASERNALVPDLSGVLLQNRLLALGLSAALLALTYALFRFEERAGRARRRRERGGAASAPPAGPLPDPEFGRRAAWAQLLARTRFDVAQAVKSPVYAVLLALGLINAIGALWFGNELYGAQIHPVTRAMIQLLEGAFTILTLIIAIFYAGELVWRERDRRTEEIVGAAAAPDWAFLFPKVLAIVIVLVSTLLVSVLAAVLVQALRGYTHFELDKYLLWYVLPQSIDWTLVAILAVFLQVVSPHKFIGWLLMLAYVVLRFALPNLGLEHNLYRFAETPSVPLSDMNGMGRFWIGAAWLRLYWAAFCVILLVLSYGLWRRGADTALRARLSSLPRRLNGPAGAILTAAVVVFAATGVFIFINTNVWNDYRTDRDDERWQARFEKTLLRYESVPQPRIVDERLDVDIRPRQRRVVTKGVYVIQNRTAEPLREVHLRFPRELKMRSLIVGGARPERAFDDLNYRIFTFDTPMRLGERRTVAFTSTLEQRGFRNNRDLTEVVGNGTFLNDRLITPSLGIDRKELLRDRSVRRRNKLPPDLRMPKLGTPGADRFNALSRDSDWVTASIRVATDADQIAIAPGQRVSERVADGRRVAEFRTRAPIMRYFSVQSARYAVKRDQHRGVDLTVYYHPAHAYNVERMIASMKRSLDYLQAAFSPYQFQQMRFLEFPAFQGRFAQSFAGTVPWSEELGFIADFKDPEKIDYVTYVSAHEIAHQWWGHQLSPADEQGSTFLVETLAQYSALMVMKHTYGPDLMRRFLKFELDRYLRDRGGEAVEELPLSRVEDQPYIHYRKGSVVMYRLQDEIGEAAVNTALKRLLAHYAFKGAPYPTTLDFLREIRAVAPADKQALITDLFERITLYDVKTTSAEARKRADGRYDVTMTVSARKLYADGQGRERAAPMNEVLDVGLFLAEPGKKAFAADKVLTFRRLPIRLGEQVLRFTTARAPVYAGADPYNKLVDRNSEDNLLRVTAR
ncbi:MAG TPA: M1 family aminopeptidase [Caulobacteraceae bacterium]|jgi:aminopeptidase N